MSYSADRLQLPENDSRFDNIEAAARYNDSASVNSSAGTNLVFVRTRVKIASDSLDVVDSGRNPSFQFWGRDSTGQSWVAHLQTLRAVLPIGDPLCP